jgi:hypothetical protein
MMFFRRRSSLVRSPSAADIVAAQQAVAVGIRRENVQAKNWVGIPIAQASVSISISLRTKQKSRAC